MIIKNNAAKRKNRAAYYIERPARLNRAAFSDDRSTFIIIRPVPIQLKVYSACAEFMLIHHLLKLNLRPFFLNKHDIFINMS